MATVEELMSAAMEARRVAQRALALAARGTFGGVVMGSDLGGAGRHAER
ncbi:MAG TPA: hypothetical protein VNG13_00160 [Mycobacteriales bacterium]|nr:hypothetical protein [Mycobacteriales bacterium]